MSFIGAITAIILFALSGFVNKFEIVYQLSSLIIAMISVQLYIKYVGSDYVYEATDKELKIYKINGKKSICVCCLDYEGSLTNVIDSREFFENKQNYKKYNFCVNYMKNINPQNYFVYMFEFNSKITLMKFEPDEVFVTFLNSNLKKVLENKEEI